MSPGLRMVASSGFNRPSWAWLLVVGIWMLTASCVVGEACQGGDMDEAWAAYRAGRIGEADRLFGRVLDACSSSVGARTGLGYVALARDDLDGASRWFGEALGRDPDAIDPLIGRGMVAWRQRELDEARVMFERVLSLDPDNRQVQSYLAGFPPEDGFPERDSLSVPDTLVHRFRVAGSRFQRRGPEGWEEVYVKGVNLGAAIPGSHPSEFPDSATYASWLRLIGAMGANAVRLYTVHPPNFYDALLGYNRSHPSAPLHLYQGVWAGNPPGGVDYDDADWLESFYEEVRAAVDIVHGRADLPPFPDRASGSYTADVSSWTMGFIVGREWEPRSVARYVQDQEEGRGSWSGQYVSVQGGNAMDVWLTRAMDHLVSYETEKYNTQRPVAYTNSPATDPLRHPTEASPEEEQRIRRSFGDEEPGTGAVGDDSIGLDPSLVTATDRFRAGHFAAYHVHPYHPDFMVLDPGLNQAESPFGPSNYWGYLVNLREYHSRMPILIASYGVPTSIGIAHLQPQGWHHGGNTESEMAEINARLTQEIAAAGMAGGIVFEWIDEWFKQTWNTRALEVPAERDRLWYNVMDPGEHYGLLAAEPVPAIEGPTFDERLEAWQTVIPSFATADGSTLRATTDEAYLWLLVEYGREIDPASDVMVGFDVVDPERGEFQWPGARDSDLPVGVEFVLSVSGGDARLQVHPAFKPSDVDTLALTLSTESPEWPPIADAPAGFFRGRFVQKLNLPLWPEIGETGRFLPLRVVTNRIRFGRDSTEYGAMGYDSGVLPEGEPPDGLWQRTSEAVEVRIPWQLLNLGDPSQRRVLASPSESGDDDPRSTTLVPGIRLLFGFRTGSSTRQWPSSREGAEGTMVSWNTWNAPRWTTRLRPTYWSVQEAWADIQSPSSSLDVTP